MVRKFIPFEPATITEEFRRLDSPHRAKLMYAMERFQESFIKVAPAAIKSGYPQGILEIRHQEGVYKGRALFFERTSEQLIVLIVYRKESNKTPKRFIGLALNRKHTHEKR